MASAAHLNGSAAVESHDAEDSVPGTQHLLLGLLHVGVAANVLDKLGVTRDRVREASARLIEPAGGGEGLVWWATGTARPP